MPEWTRCTHQDLVPAEKSEPTFSTQSSASSSKPCAGAPATHTPSTLARTADLVGQPYAQVGAARGDGVEPAQLPQWRVHGEEHEHVVADVEHGGEGEHALFVVREVGRLLTLDAGVDHEEAHAVVDDVDEQRDRDRDDHLN
eukprot:scaffold68386_cov58-Phaeocystis_antarctica.AAC.1